jgi:hypothetical protein
LLRLGHATSSAGSPDRITYRRSVNIFASSWQRREAALATALPQAT